MWLDLYHTFFRNVPQSEFLRLVKFIFSEKVCGQWSSWRQIRKIGQYKNKKEQIFNGFHIFLPWWISSLWAYKAHTFRTFANANIHDRCASDVLLISLHHFNIYLYIYIIIIIFCSFSSIITFFASPLIDIILKRLVCPYFYIEISRIPHHFCSNDL